MDSIVERRLRYIERQKKLHAESVNVDPRLAPGDGHRCRRNRHGMPQLPIGQHVVKNWPVLDLGDVPDGRSARLAARGRRPGRKSGHVDVGRVPGAAAGRRRQRLSLRDDVEPLRQPLEGRAFQDDRRARRCRKTRRISSCAPATTTCRAREIPYTTNLPLARAIEDDVLLVHTWEGAPLPREHGGPVRMITPKLYAWKGAKWIRKIEFLERDQRGFWEVRGYSNTAEPWAERSLQLNGRC